MKRTALFDPSRCYRYLLTREWEGDLFRRGRGTILSIGLNPSKADEEREDNTITREINFARDWGYARFVKVNLFALVSTDPHGLTLVEDPVGPGNDDAIRGEACEAIEILCCWGSFHGLGTLVEERAQTVLRMLRDDGHAHKLICLGRNRSGAPAHPLYLAADTKRQPFTEVAE